MKLKCLLAGTLAICLGINSNVVVFAKKSEYVRPFIVSAFFLVSFTTTL